LTKIARPIKRKVLRGVQPNAGLAALYRRRLTILIDRMSRDVTKAIRAAYGARDPEVMKLAGDESPAAAMRRLMRELTSRWTRSFDLAAPRLAKWFATAASQRSDAALRKILRDAGIMIDWKMTAAQNDVLSATIGEQVGLIKSIPSQYFTQIEGMVYRSVAAGGDLKQLSDDLEKHFKVTRKRAEFIARDQVSKANAVNVRTRQLEAGLTLALWRHSHAGKFPRKSHLEMDGKEYDVRKGMWDSTEQKFVYPGQLINCRCFSRPVVAGFS
jgi:uncharacterized protein with gpF-like domain